MPQEIRMPSLGQTSDEFRIIAWLKSEGDRVTVGEPLFQVETDKATLEVESFAAGTLLKIVRRADDVVETGAILAYVGTPGESLTAVEPPRVASVPSQAPGPPRPVTAEAAPLGEGKVLASPAARQLAREHGLDLSTVRGTGPGGRIEKADVLAGLQNAG